MDITRRSHQRRSRQRAGGGRTDPRSREWEQPGVFAVTEGVHRIPLPLPGDGLRAVNVYAIEDGGALTLVDSGWALSEARQRLETALAGIGHELGDVRRFLVTHVHRDHYTLAIAVRRLFGSRVLLGAGEQESLQLIINRSESPASVYGRLMLRPRCRPDRRVDTPGMAGSRRRRRLGEARRVAGRDR